MRVKELSLHNHTYGKEKDILFITFEEVEKMYINSVCNPWVGCDMCSVFIKTGEYEVTEYMEMRVHVPVEPFKYMNTILPDMYLYWEDENKCRAYIREERGKWYMSTQNRDFYQKGE